MRVGLFCFEFIETKATSRASNSLKKKGVYDIMKSSLCEARIMKRKVDGKETLFILVIILLFQTAVAFTVSAIYSQAIVCIVLAPIFFALAIASATAFGVKKNGGRKQREREAKFFASLYAFAEANGVSALPEPLKTFFVLDCQLFASMSEYGFELYFSDPTHDKNDLIPACDNLGNAELTAICRDAIALSNRYDFSDVEALPKKCTSEIEKLDDRFFALCDKTDLPAAIEKYYKNRGGKKDEAALEEIKK